MDGGSDWDLSAVVRSCNNLNGGNSSSQDVHDHFYGDFPSQSCDSILGDFPNLVTERSERRYFGLEEVLDCFTNRKKREPPLVSSRLVEESSGHTKKREPSLVTSGLAEETSGPQSAITPPTSKPRRSLDKADGSGGRGKKTRATKSPQIDSSEKGGGLEYDKPKCRGKEVKVVEVAAEKIEEWDGWVWRKYGMKRVCDSPYSKSYYRCSHEGNNCLAKKHVQQSQKDESKYIVTYKGNHIHPPPVQSNTTKRRKRSKAPAPRAGKEECPISPPTTNNSS